MNSSSSMSNSSFQAVNEQNFEKQILKQNVPNSKEKKNYFEDVESSSKQMLQNQDFNYQEEYFDPYSQVQASQKKQNQKKQSSITPKKKQTKTKNNDDDFGTKQKSQKVKSAPKKAQALKKNTKDVEMKNEENIQQDKNLQKKSQSSSSFSNQYFDQDNNIYKQDDYQNRNAKSPANQQKNQKTEKAKTPRQPRKKKAEIKNENTNKQSKSMDNRIEIKYADQNQYQENEAEDQNDRDLLNRDTNKYGIIQDNRDPLGNGIYSIGKILGSGMIGVACLCQNEQTSQLFCLKYMSLEKIKEKNLYKNIKEEVQIMYELMGVPGVCQLEDVIINEDKDITIVLPFYALTDLWNFMKVKPGRHLSEKDSRKVFSQLVDTFIFIHEKQIMHRDIKPENILVKNDQLDICLSDFGLATHVGPQPKYDRTRTGQAGTPCYYSYEIIKKIPYDERVDIWCLGVLLFEMLFGALPFSHAPQDPRDYSASISSLQFRFPSKSDVSQEARDLIRHILVQQEKRITLKQIKQHQWMQLDLDLHF